MHKLEASKDTIQNSHILNQTVLTPSSGVFKNARANKRPYLRESAAHVFTWGHYAPPGVQLGAAFSTTADGDRARDDVGFENAAAGVYIRALAACYAILAASRWLRRRSVYVENPLFSVDRGSICGISACGKRESRFPRRRAGRKL